MAKKKEPLVSDDGYTAKYENPPIKAISYSTINAFMGETGCPYKLSKTKVEGQFDSENENLKRGNAAHKDAEDYIKGEVDHLPKSIKLFVDEFEYLRDEYRNDTIYSEEKWAFNKNWEECEYFAKDCYSRIIMDLHFLNDEEDGVLEVVDFKTGRVRGEYVEQVELYALAAFKMFDVETVREVRGSLWFLDHGIIVGSDDKGVPNKNYVFKREDEARLTAKWNQKALKVTECTSFPANKNIYCKYCHIHESKGGTCKMPL